MGCKGKKGPDMTNNEDNTHDHNENDKTNEEGEDNKQGHGGHGGDHENKPGDNTEPEQETPPHSDDIIGEHPEEDPDKIKNPDEENGHASGDKDCHKKIPEPIEEPEPIEPAPETPEIQDGPGELDAASFVEDPLGGDPPGEQLETPDPTITP